MPEDQEPNPCKGTPEDAGKALLEPSSDLGDTLAQSERGDGDCCYFKTVCSASCPTSFVLHLKTDRAKEFVSKRFREWTATRDLEHCHTAGDEATANSRAEIVAGVLKNATRGSWTDSPRLANCTTPCGGRETPRPAASSRTRLCLMVAKLWRGQSHGAVASTNGSTP